MSRSYRAHQAHAHAAHPSVRVAILTASDSRDASSDDSGRLIAALLDGHEVLERRVVRDDVRAIRRAADGLLALGAEVLLVNGGTGIAPRDVTIEALAPWFVKELPGFGERLRTLSGRDVGGGAWLSRATAGVVQRGRRRALVFLLPGSPDACRLAVARLIRPELPHAVSLLHGSKPHG